MKLHTPLVAALTMLLARSHSASASEKKLVLVVEGGKTLQHDDAVSDRATSAATSTWLRGVVKTTIDALPIQEQRDIHRALNNKKKKKKKMDKKFKNHASDSSSSSDEESGLVCDETAGGFHGIEGSPWVYPFPRLITGLDFALAGALQLPLTTSDAQGQDWSFDAASCKWSNLDLAPRFRLSFVDGSISAVEVLAEAPLLVGASFFTDTGLEVFFRDDEEGTFALSDQIGTTYPPTFVGAEADGWIEGGCSGYMGGSHYYKLPFENSSPITPIYDRYGSGTLDAFQISIDFLNGVDGQGVDFMGLNPTSAVFGCAFNNCNAEGCIESSKVTTNGSTDIEVSAASTIHLFWGLDPGDLSTWAPCQAPFGVCQQTTGCTCCGTPDDFFSQHCPKAWPPVFPE